MKKRSALLKLALCLLFADIISAFSQAQQSGADWHYGIGPDTWAGVTNYPGLDNLPGRRPPRIWDGLSNAWSARQLGWLSEEQKAPSGAVIFLGDSITQFWKTLEADFPNLKVLNRGINGDNTCGVLYRLKVDVLDLDPSEIVLLIGTNDIGFGGSAEDAAANIRLILLAIRRHNPNIKVIVCKVMPRQEQHGAGVFSPDNAEKVQKLNSLLGDIVKDNKSWALCDTWTPFTTPEGSQATNLFDGSHLHLNAQGYEAWKSALVPVMQRLDTQN